MFIGLSSINRGKITSTNSTHPTSQNAKQIPDQHNAQNKRLIAKRFSAWIAFAMLMRSGNADLLQKLAVAD